MTLQPTSPQVLIVYYSRTGHTASVAHSLARLGNVDLEALVTTADRRGILGYLLSGYEGVAAREARIQPPIRNPRDYDIVLLGTPTWCSALSSPMRTYLHRYAGILPSVGFFVTSGGPGGARVLEQMQSISGKKPLATLALRERDLEHQPSVYFAQFWEDVLMGWEALCARAAQ